MSLFDFIGQRQRQHVELMSHMLILLQDNPEGLYWTRIARQTGQNTGGKHFSQRMNTLIHMDLIKGTVETSSRGRKRVRYTITNKGKKLIAEGERLFRRVDRWISEEE